MKNGLTGMYRSGMDRVLQRFDPRVVDAVLAIAIAVFALIEVWPASFRSRTLGPDRLDPLLLAGGPGACVDPAARLRRRYPVAVLLVIGASMATWLLRGGESPGAVFLAFFVAIFSASAYATDRRRSLFGYGVLTACFSGCGGSPDSSTRGSCSSSRSPRGSGWPATRVRARTVEAREHERRATEIERQRTTALRQAAAEERARIARELHDVIAHNLSVDRDPGRRRATGPRRAAGGSARGAAAGGGHRTRGDDRDAPSARRRAAGRRRPLTVPRPGAQASRRCSTTSARLA